MNVFLTGLTGFCGSNIARHLLHTGHSIWGLTRCQSTHSSVGFGPTGHITIVSGDLASLSALPPAIDTIIHTAAVSPGPTIRTSDFIQHNVLGTEHMIQLASQAGVRKFIFFSSLSLYGNIETPIVHEDTPIVNPGAYGTSKLLGEFLLRDRAPEMSSIALRLPGVLGSGARRHWLASITAQARRGQDIRIFNPDADFNNAVHLADLGSLIESLLVRNWTGFDAITLGADGGMSIREIAVRVVDAAGTTARIQEHPAPQPHFTVSSERAKAVYGYRPMTFETMLTRYLSKP